MADYNFLWIVRVRATGLTSAPGGASMEQDVVCGMQVDPETAKDKSEYNGRTYYFCSPECKDEFDMHPKQYIVEAA
jgi:YHS domain-containing protein